MFANIFFVFVSFVLGYVAAGYILDPKTGWPRLVMLAYVNFVMLFVFPIPFISDPMVQGVCILFWIVGLVLGWLATSWLLKHKR